MQVLRKLITDSCAKMEKSSNFDEISDVGCFHPSPSADHSATDAWTYSEASNLSDSIDDSSYASEPSPSRWTAAKPGAKQAVLSRLGMKLRKNSVDAKLNECDLLDSGWFAQLEYLTLAVWISTIFIGN